MKKIFMLAAVFCLLTAVMPVLADAVWTPMDDYYWELWQTNSDEACRFQDRAFYLAAGDRGYVTSVKTPLDQTRVNSYPNGTEFKITFVCGKGDNLWGAVEAFRPEGEKEFIRDWQNPIGYINFNDLVRAYDTYAFSEDHQDEIRPFDGSGYDYCSAGDFVVWQTPNSGVQVEYVYSDYVDSLCTDQGLWSGYGMFTFGGIYVDPDGKRWVEVTLRRDPEHGWFCLDAMTDGGVRDVG